MKKLIIRITAILTAVYFLFMAALSINILNRDEALFQTTINYEIRGYAETIWSYMERQGVDEHFNDWLKTSVFTVNYNKDCEIALFDSEYNLLACSGDEWIVSYNNQENHLTERVFFDPLKYFSEVGVQELENLFLNTNDSPQKKGDFVRYSFSLSGWVNNLDFIPEKISVNKDIFINEFSTESIPTDKEFVNLNLPQNTADMKYIDFAYFPIIPKYSIDGMDYSDFKEESRRLRSIATDKKRLEMKLSNQPLAEKRNISYAVC